MSDLTVHLCGVDSSSDMTGIKPPRDNKCPDCNGELYMGYGLMGGGMGVYWMCIEGDDCKYFFKRPDDEE